MGVKLGGRPGDCPVTEDASERLLRLPFYNDLEEAQQETGCLYMPEPKFYIR